MLKTDLMLELHVPDFVPVKKFYIDLGFKVVWERDDKDKRGYMVLKMGETILNFFCGSKRVFNQSYFKRFSKNTVRGYGVEIIIFIDNIDAFYKKIKAKYEDKIVLKLRNHFGHKDFRMVDPFGYYLRFVERYDWVDGRDRHGDISNK